MDVKGSNRSVDAIVSELYDQIYTQAAGDVQTLKLQVEAGISRRKDLRALTLQADLAEKAMKSATANEGGQAAVDKLKTLLHDIEKQFPDSALTHAVSLDSTKGAGITDDKNKDGKIDWYMFDSDKRDAAWGDYFKTVKDALKAAGEDESDLSQEQQLDLNRLISILTRAEQARGDAQNKFAKGKDALAGGLRG